jgi:propanol-preferring alcohol dehydrogenase
MKAWLFTGAHQPLQLIERDTPRPGPRELLVEVRGAGLCHSDVGVLDGTITEMLPKKPPLILGHEVAGVVVEAGPGVTGFKPGDRIVASGDEAFCPGWSADGGYATHCILATSCAARLPEGVDFIQGAAATDAGQTSYGAVMGAGGLQPGMRVGIVGLGGLGMTGARIAVVNGAAEVYAAEPRREAWDTARAQGVKEVVEDVMGLAPYELDLIVDFAGFGVTTAGAILAVRPGGLVVQVGLGVSDATISTAMLVAKAVTLRGSKGGRPGDTEKVLAHMQNGELKIQAATIGFDEIPAGLERLERGGVIGRLVAQPNG